MVNEVLLKYFQSNMVKFQMADLKKMAVKGGYPQKDIDEAVKFLNAEKKSGVEKIPRIPRKGGFRWLRWTGIFMFVFLAIGLLNFVVGFLPSGARSIFSIGVGIISLIGIVIFVGGWFGLAKYTNSRLMRFGLLGILITGLVSAILMLGFVITIWMKPSLVVALGGFNFALIGAYLLAGLFVLICFILVQVALIKLRKEIRFAGWVGVLSLILVFIGFVMVGLQTFAMRSFFNSGFLAGGTLAGGVNAGGGSFATILLIITIISIVVGIISLINSILAGLMFFDASKKFES